MKTDVKSVSNYCWIIVFYINCVSTYQNNFIYVGDKVIPENNLTKRSIRLVVVTHNDDYHFWHFEEHTIF